MTVRLHRDMRVQMIKRAVCLLATVPSTFVHSLNFFVAATWALVLLSTRNRDEGVDLRKRVRILRILIRLKAVARKGGDDKPGQDVVQRSLPRNQRTLPFQESCKDRADHVDVPHTAVASQDDHTSAAADGLGIATCRDLVGRRASKDRGM